MVILRQTIFSEQLITRYALIPGSLKILARAIVRTLNAQYQMQPYGLGNASTTYPVSAFITDLVYLEGTTVHVDVKHITVSVLRIFTSHAHLIVYISL